MKALLISGGQEMNEQKRKCGSQAPCRFRKRIGIHVDRKVVATLPALFVLLQDDPSFLRGSRAQFDNRQRAAEINNVAGVLVQQPNFSSPQVIFRRVALPFEEFGTLLFVHVDRRYSLRRSREIEDYVRRVMRQWVF